MMAAVEDDERSKVWVKCPYCSYQKSSLFEHIAIREVVWHSVRNHHRRAVVAELLKQGFTYQDELDYKSPDVVKIDGGGRKNNMS
jgi:hypothetical protein